MACHQRCYITCRIYNYNYNDLGRCHFVECNFCVMPLYGSKCDVNTLWCNLKETHAINVMKCDVCALRRLFMPPAAASSVAFVIGWDAMPALSHPPVSLSFLFLHHHPCSQPLENDWYFARKQFNRKITLTDYTRMYTFYSFIYCERWPQMGRHDTKRTEENNTI